MEEYIAFPNLGLKFNVGRGIQITDSYSIKWYGIIICLAFVLCVILGLRSCEKRGLKKDDLMDYILITVPSAIIGARLYFVIFYPGDTYKENPLKIFEIWNGGLAIYGGIIGAILAVFIVSRVKKHNAVFLFDFMLPYICLGQAIGRWGNFFNQEAYGGTTTLPWGMTGDLISAEFGDSLVHPTFLYESLWCFIAFAIMTALYFVLYGAERAVIEGMRTDSLMLGSVRVSQLLSAILCVAGIFLLIFLQVRKKKALAEEIVEDDSSIARLVRTMEAQEGVTETEDILPSALVEDTTDVNEETNEEDSED